jgi:hypothetical protein
METGTEILIARMASHPEEFIEGLASKWARAMSMANDWLPEEDKQALREANKRMQIEQFNGEVLATLAGEHESPSIHPLGTAQGTIRYKAEGRYATGFGQAQIKAEGNPLQHSTNTIVNPWATKDEMNAMYNPAQARAFK